MTGPEEGSGRAGRGSSFLRKSKLSVSSLSGAWGERRGGDGLWVPGREWWVCRRKPSFLGLTDGEEGQQPREHRNAQQNNIKLQKGPRGNSAVWRLKEHGSRGQGSGGLLGSRVPPEVPWPAGATRAVPGKEEPDSQWAVQMRAENVEGSGLGQIPGPRPRAAEDGPEGGGIFSEGP